MYGINGHIMKKEIRSFAVVLRIKLCVNVCDISADVSTIDEKIILKYIGLLSDYYKTIF